MSDALFRILVLEPSFISLSLCSLYSLRPSTGSCTTLPVDDATIWNCFELNLIVIFENYIHSIFHRSAADLCSGCSLTSMDGRCFEFFRVVSW
jgi:hypothetical protein